MAKVDKMEAEQAIMPVGIGCEVPSYDACQRTISIIESSIIVLIVHCLL